MADVLQMVTAAGAESNALNPTLDSIAAGQREVDLIHRPATPEADSLLELLVEAQRTISHMGELLVRLAAVNDVQVDHARETAGWADGLVTSLRDAERNEPAAVLSGRQLARRLNPLLDALDDPLRLEGQPAARAELHRIFAAVPREQIMRDAVLYHVGTRRLAVLDSAQRARERNRRRRAAAQEGEVA